MVTLTEKAASKIRELMAEEPEGEVGVLRVAIQGGGCSGFQYKYDLVPDQPAPDDVVLARDGAKVLIDTMSLQYMGGAQIDFVDDLMGQSFQVRNPLATAACGCGTSFSI